jgi:hypothetical protein
MSVEGIQIWVEGVAIATPVAAIASIIANVRILVTFFIASTPLQDWILSFASLIKGNIAQPVP